MEPEKQPDLNISHNTQRYLNVTNTPIASEQELNQLLTSQADVGISARLNLSDLQTRHNYKGELLNGYEDDLNKARKYSGKPELTYADYSQCAFRSATIGVPCPEGVSFAARVAEQLRLSIENGQFDRAHSLVAGISAAAHDELCKFYKLAKDETEVIFDNNATVALFHYLDVLNLPPDTRMLTFEDTGWLVKPALEGKNPENSQYDFKPSVDFWNNRLLTEKSVSLNVNFTDVDSEGEIGPYSATTLQGTAADSFNLELLKNSLREEVRTASSVVVVVIPTVTSSGIIVPFRELCDLVRNEAEQAEKRAILVVDDCQGMGRLPSSHYTPLVSRDESASIWNYSDALMVTGAKAVGALVGSGAMLMNKQKFENSQKDFVDATLTHRKLQYAFHSIDSSRVQAWNNSAQGFGVAQTVEISSLLVALKTLPPYEDLANKIISLRTQFENRFDSIEGIQVIRDAPEGVRFVDSFLRLKLDLPPGKKGDDLKNELLCPIGGNHIYGQYPISLPAVLTGKNGEVLRVPIMPRQISSKDYEQRLYHLADAMEQRMREMS